MERKACVAGVSKEQAALIETMSLIPLEAQSDPVDDELEHEQDVSPSLLLMLCCALHPKRTYTSHLSTCVCLLSK